IPECKAHLATKFAVTPSSWVGSRSEVTSCFHHKRIALELRETLIHTHTLPLSETVYPHALTYIHIIHHRLTDRHTDRQPHTHTHTHTHIHTINHMRTDTQNQQQHTNTPFLLDCYF